MNIGSMFQTDARYTTLVVIDSLKDGLLSCL